MTNNIFTPLEIYRKVVFINGLINCASFVVPNAGLKQNRVINQSPAHSGTGMWTGDLSPNNITESTTTVHFVKQLSRNYRLCIYKYKGQPIFSGVRDNFVVMYCIYYHSVMSKFHLMNSSLLLCPQIVCLLFVN